WGDGHYELTADVLAPVATLVVDKADIVASERVLDLGCGTGNAALVAARLGADVVALDPAPRLLEVTALRAQAEGLTVSVAPGEAANTNLSEDSFDVVVANFSVIFAPNAAEAVREMIRITRPGGRVVLTTWLTRGAIHDSVAAMLRYLPGADFPDSPWGSEAGLRTLFAGYAIDVQARTVPFNGESPQGWFDEQVAEHPAWRAIHSGIKSAGGDWVACREEAIETLANANEDPSAFLVTSDYFLVRVDV
ncbi:MAG: class I SAM-dependent methyltransferase, partial [Myxococcota bacterium]